ncbi:MAG: hypothetical protein IT353_13945 [Gemmatimonadaceae bacterium]|nr:hypothetical protein [Gemmatimonadaceae bacterium]
MLRVQGGLDAAMTAFRMDLIAIREMQAVERSTERPIRNPPRIPELEIREHPSAGRQVVGLSSLPEPSSAD